MREGDRGAYTLAEIGALFRALGDLHDEVISSVEELRRCVTALEAESQDLRSAVHELDERLDNLLSERTEGRADLHDATHMAHLNLAADYRSLVMQWMQRVARKVVKDRNRAKFEYELGCQVADFTQLLFGGEVPDTHAVLSSLEGADLDTLQLAESMCSRASSLRSSIGDIGVYHEWDFRTEISGVLNDDRQEAWLTCDPSNPVCLIVAPAYLVQGVVYAKQLVATEASGTGK